MSCIKLDGIQEKYLKCYQDLVVTIEKVGGNSKLVLKDINKMSVHELIDIMSRNGITFKTINERKYNELK